MNNKESDVDVKKHMEHLVLHFSDVLVKSSLGMWSHLSEISKWLDLDRDGTRLIEPGSGGMAIQFLPRFIEVEVFGRDFDGKLCISNKRIDIRHVDRLETRNSKVESLNVHIMDLIDRFQAERRLALSQYGNSQT